VIIVGLRNSLPALALVGALGWTAGCSADGANTSSPAAGKQTTSAAASAPAAGKQTTGAAASTPAGGAGSGPSGQATSPGAPDSTPQPPPSKSTDGSQKAVLAALPGAASGCVAVGSKTDVRSGAMAAGNFASARKEYASQPKGPEDPVVTLYAIPQDAKAMPGLTVTMKRLSGSEPARTVRSTSSETANSWSYYNVRLPVSAAGTWRLTMAAGSNKGCFDVSFGS
jgi:hypothetical protein